jgi:enoyl-CoA hydratase
MDPLVFSETRGHAALLRLHRPARANAYDEALLSALEHALEQHAAARVIVICGSGRHFCAGADRDEQRARRPLDALALASARVFDRLAAWPVPTIAAIHGAALGGGLELALACDLRVAAPDAVLGLPETSLGILPAAGGTVRLPAAIGMARAKALIFTARRVSGAEALGLGLINEVADDPVERALQIADEIAANDPLAVSLAKRALHSGAHPGPSQALLYARRDVHA